jgi:hypothetical protein
VEPVIQPEERLTQMSSMPQRWMVGPTDGAWTQFTLTLKDIAGFPRDFMPELLWQLCEDVAFAPNRLRLSMHAATIWLPKALQQRDVWDIKWAAAVAKQSHLIEMPHVFGKLSQTASGASTCRTLHSSSFHVTALNSCARPFRF